MRLLSAAAVISLALIGCGQKGLLYLRDAPPPGVKPAKPEATKPVPYPTDPQRGDAAEK